MHNISIERHFASWPSFKVIFMLILLIQHTLRHIFFDGLVFSTQQFILTNRNERRLTHARHTALKAEGRPPLVIYFEGQ